MDRYESPIRLPDEYFRLIGIIAAQWEHVEYLLEWAVAEIAGLKPSHVGLLTANIGFQSKLDVIMVYGRALQSTKPDEWKRLTTALKDIRDAYGFRNTYIHAKWIQPRRKKDPVQRSVVRTKGGNLHLGDFPTSTVDLAKAAQAIDTAGDNFMALMQTYGLLKPKRRTSRKK